jgi:hypothetical protein
MQGVQQAIRRFDAYGRALSAAEDVDAVFVLHELILSTRQIAQELDLNKVDAQCMAEVLRSGVVEKKPETVLSGAVECDEVYVGAGNKGQPPGKRPRNLSITHNFLVYFRKFC